MGTSFSDLPSEILFDILAKVPAKSLFLCRFVSKLWYDIIDEHYFITTHLMDEARKKSQLLSYNFDKDTLSLRLCLLHVNGSNNLTQSKHSIIHLFNYKFSFRYSCEGIFLFGGTNHKPPPLLLNPLSGEFLQLPELLPEVAPWLHLQEVYGLGFDFKSRVYKVVYIPIYSLNLIGVAQVLTLGDSENSWRKISSILPADFHVEQNAVTTRGYIHWLFAYSINGGNYEDHVFSFNVEMEEFISILCPKSRTKYVGKSYLSSWRNSLALVYFLSSKKRIEVWVLNTENWTKAFQIPKIDLKFLFRGEQIPRPCVPRRLLGEWNNGFLFEIIRGNSYMLYDSEKRSTKFLNVLAGSYFGVDIFTPNLASLTNRSRQNWNRIIHLED